MFGGYVQELGLLAGGFQEIVGGKKEPTGCSLGTQENISKNKTNNKNKENQSKPSKNTQAANKENTPGQTSKNTPKTPEY